MAASRSPRACGRCLMRPPADELHPPPEAPAARTSRAWNRVAGNVAGECCASPPRSAAELLGAPAKASAFPDYRWKLHLPKDYFVTAPPPPPGEFVVSPLDPSSERGPCAPPRGPFLKICFFRYTRLHTSRVRALETASFTLEGAAATCEEITMDETMVVLLTHDARQVERALRRALHCPQQHSKLPAPHLLALVP